LAEQDISRKDQVSLQRSKTATQLLANSEKKEYFSLPPIVLKKTTSAEPLASTTTTDNDIEEQNGDSVRRNRIEKYKEERRQALRQRYHLDGSLDDQKDEEMIRRIKQKISKNENGSVSEVQNRLNFDSSPSDDNELAKEIGDKPPTAVTTISILYTSRRRRDSSEMAADTNFAPDERLSPDDSENCGIGDSVMLMSKSYNLTSEPTKDWSYSNTTSSDSRRPFTSSLERKVKSFVRQESLVAKRVNQFAEASESSELTCRRNGESGSVQMMSPYNKFG